MATLSRRIFEEVWNKKDLTVIDEIVAPDYLHHDPQNPNVTGGVEGYKQFVRQYQSAFPDLVMTIDEEIEAGDTVITRWTARGIHNGDLLGLPRTGRSISVTGISVARTNHGKITESWNVWDTLGMLHQLGAIHQPTDRAAA